MATTYFAQDRDGRVVEYRDRKRLAWTLSVLYPLMPFLGIGLHAATGQPVTPFGRDGRPASLLAGLLAHARTLVEGAPNGEGWPVIVQ